MACAQVTYVECCRRKLKTQYYAYSNNAPRFPTSINHSPKSPTRRSRATVVPVRLPQNLTGPDKRTPDLTVLNGSYSLVKTYGDLPPSLKLVEKAT